MISLLLYKLRFIYYYLAPITSGASLFNKLQKYRYELNDNILQMSVDTYFNSTSRKQIESQTSIRLMHNLIWYPI